MSAKWRCAAASCAAFAALAGCGGGDDGLGDSTPTTPPLGAKKGGDLTVLYHGDVDDIDPGVTDHRYGLEVAYTTQRPLYSYKPDDATNPQPDLAAGPPRISRDGRTLTIRIRSGVRFSPPVDRAVTSRDVRYGLERGFLKSVGGPYVGRYLADVVGVAAYRAGKTVHVAGLQTPDAQTLVIKLTRPRAAFVAGALSLPASAPVPEEYAAPYDARQPSTYGRHQVATGPYMVENDDSGALTGYVPGTEIRLVRNPNWDPSTDYKPAYLDSITVSEGIEPDVAVREIVSGSHVISGDLPLNSSTLQRVATQNRPLLVLTPPTGRYRYIALNTRVAPFSDPDVRRAIVAGFDRNALRAAFGGALLGEVPTHYIPPGQPGFEAAGGSKGPGLDFMSHPSGDLALAARYFREAGYRSGRYDGGGTFTLVSDSGPQELAVSRAAAQQLERLGFRVRLRAVPRAVMLSKYCEVPAAEPAVCPSVDWIKDFADPETLLEPVFDGAAIRPQQNPNVSLLDDPTVNAQMARAAVLNGPDQRNAAWGAVDRQITALAPGIPWLWDKQPLLHAQDVNGVVNVAQGTWDLSSTSIR